MWNTQQPRFSCTAKLSIEIDWNQLSLIWNFWDWLKLIASYLKPATFSFCRHYQSFNWDWLKPFKINWNQFGPFETNPSIRLVEIESYKITSNQLSFIETISYNSFISYHYQKSKKDISRAASEPLYINNLILVHQVKSWSKFIKVRYYQTHQKGFRTTSITFLVGCSWLESESPSPWPNNNVFRKWSENYFIIFGCEIQVLK